MKRSSIVWQFALLAAIGCSANTDPVASTTTPATETPVQAPATDVATDGSQTPADSEAAATTFVSLKVPNMV